VRVGTDVGRALHVVVTTEDVGTAARHADVAERELQAVVGTHVVGADGVLRAAHAPDEGAGTALGQGPGDLQQRITRHAGDPLDFLRIPLLDLFAHLVHAIDALADVLRVFPLVLEDVPQDAPDQRDVGTGTEAHVDVGMRGGTREARIHDDHLGAAFLGAQDHLHRHRVRLGGVRAAEDHALGVVDVVVGVRLRTITPGVRNAGHRGGVADARLVVAVVRAPEGGELALQVGAFVVGLGRAGKPEGVGSGFLADLEHLVADLVDRLLPADALPLAADHLHRILDPALAVAVVAQGRALGAVRAEVDRAVEGRLLTDPHAVLHFGNGRTADRTVTADGLDLLDLGLGVNAARSLGLLDHRAGQDAGHCRTPDCQTGTAQEGATGDGLAEQAGSERARCRTVFLDQFHGSSPRWGEGEIGR